MDLKKKHEIEEALREEHQEVSAGRLKEDNPLDDSGSFREFCEACRRGDLKLCQEKIQEGVNINARDEFDYTPLILVSSQLVPSTTLLLSNFGCARYSPPRLQMVDRKGTRLASVDTMKLYSCFSKPAHYVSETHFKANDACIMR